jgi:hypothetical protein
MFLQANCDHIGTIPETEHTHRDHAMSRFGLVHTASEIELSPVALMEALAIAALFRTGAGQTWQQLCCASAFYQTGFWVWPGASWTPSTDQSVKTAF